MSIQILALILGSGLLSTIMTLLVTRKKRRAETTGIQLDNFQKRIDIFQEIHEEQKAKIEFLEETIKELKIEYAGLKRLYEAQCEACTYRNYYHENH